MNGEPSCGLDRFADFLRPFEAAGYRYHVAATMRHSDRFQDILIHAIRV